MTFAGTYACASLAGRGGVLINGVGAATMVALVVIIVFTQGA